MSTPNSAPSNSLVFARAEMSVIVYHTQQADLAPELSGTLLVWRHRDP